MHTGKTGASYGLRLLALSHYRWASMAFILQSPKPLKTIDIHPSILGLPHPVLLIWGVTLCGMSWVLQGVEPHHLLNARFPSPGDHRLDKGSARQRMGRLCQVVGVRPVGGRGLCLQTSSEPSLLICKLGLP